MKHLDEEIFTGGQEVFLRSYLYREYITRTRIGLVPGKLHEYVKGGEKQFNLILV